jgi:hypothetical protein
MAMTASARPLLLSILVAAAACGSGAPTAPLAEKKAEIQQVAKKTESAIAFVVDPQLAKVGFTMEAPFERQDGKVPTGAVTGRIDVDPENLGKVTGLVNVDITDLVIYQQAAEQEGQYGERTKSDLQNEHMKDWLEIGDDAPPEEAMKNKLVQFALESVEAPTPARLDPKAGGDQVVTFTAMGEVRVHQRAAKKRVPMKATFHFEGDHPSSVEVETLEPLVVDLAEHDVHPRTGFGKLAEKTLSAMSPKVAKEAAIGVKFTARPDA